MAAFIQSFLAFWPGQVAPPPPSPTPTLATYQPGGPASAPGTNVATTPPGTPGGTYNGITPVVVYDPSQVASEFLAIPPPGAGSADLYFVPQFPGYIPPIPPP